ncbi:RNA polymerase sigma factor [Candidatus Hydrogenedentota bacterium]
MTWRELLDRHGPALLLYARQWTGSRSDAEDAVQDGFLRFWRSRGSLDPSTEGCLPMLFTSVKWSAIDGGRSRKRRLVREDTAASLMENTCEVFECDVDREERSKDMQKALGELPAEQREALVLKIWGGLTFQTIAGMLEIPMSTAASRYRYALASLRRKLREREKV